jgi:transposase InsO family protein
MDPKIAESIGLLRHQIISPVLMETTAAQMEYFRQMAQKDFDVPGRGARRFSPTVMKSWLYKYRKNGFSGITPKTRRDAGTFRKVSGEFRTAIRELRLQHLERSCVKFYGLCLKQGALGDPPICLETLRRILKAENLYKTREVRARKKFERGSFGELWTVDFMHGPQVLESPDGKRRRKAILLAVIDDHSRMIVGYRFGWLENTRLIEHVFKDAILAYGLPDRLYCDNGPSFSSQYLSRVCAHLGVGLVHSKPYDSPSRGKIERFFRTVREGFLTDHESNASLDLKTLNEAFSSWVRDRYHHGHHHGIEARPIDRYQISIRSFPRKRVTEETLDEHFLVTVERTVNKDCTLSINSILYEVPAKYIGRRVEVKFSQDSPGEVFLYDEGIRVSRIQPVDTFYNGSQRYNPSPRISDVALHAVASVHSDQGTQEGMGNTP